MNTTILVNLTAEQTGQSKAQTEATLNAALKIICESVASDDPVRLRDFGTFEFLHISNRDERNPQGGDSVDYVKVIKFSPAEAFQKEVNDH